VVDDDLSTPLGRNAKSKRKCFKLPVAVPRLAAGMLALFVLFCAGWALVVDDPLGGEPVAVVATGYPSTGIASNAPAAAPPGGNAEGPRAYSGPDAGAPTRAMALDPTHPAATPAAGTRTVTIIDGLTGKRQNVAIPATQDPRAPVDQRLLEPSLHGPIPRMAPDGTRPSSAYAHPQKSLSVGDGGPRIAIVVTGLGVSASVTEQAMAKLPAAATLAFAPYGSEVDRTVTRARAKGHEVLLQVPMEPFDYPDNDPGPHTLLISLNSEQNRDRLHWLMSRFQGYVGIANYMGARFTASEQALGPVLREAGQRGLIYFDDGSSPRSLAGQIASANNLAFAKAEIVLDSVPAPAHIDQALTRLEAMAHQHGSSVGIASALPASIERIAQWAKSAAERGVMLVPISVIAKKPSSI
jgi:polysaccharide deacetylase 2 family uncharacterized protein YibQ